MIQSLFREDIKDFIPYEVGEQNYKVRLDANESFIGFSEELKNKICLAVRNIDFNRYPDPDSKKLCSFYSDYCGVSKEYMMAGNGSDELIQIIVNAFLNKDDKIAVINPDFTMYKVYTEVRGGKVITLSSNENFNLDVDSIIEKVNNKKPKILILSNPNNPTGAVIPKKDILKIVEKCKCIVVIDEAYVDFYGKTVIDQISNYENLIVLRTCSKALGSAALRLGFLITNKLLLKEIKKVKPPFNVNSVSQTIGEVILKNKKYIKECINRIIQERDYLYEVLSKIDGLKVYPTEANFVLFESENAEEINRYLLEKGIKIRKFKDGRLKNCLRITAGTREENRVVIKEIEERG
ncbi:histidinol-phosphate transaminase [Clostridium ganghwense]|uniref:Histidinol-phosphate aminotransferase n=1 Tax=Clostridium ganghwense TaxID=312089 RepID=A0ABT4CRG2_9CLOT|nr:histidinol-phosphate transaminase [Clostridium ganghwense]MCY6371632.1 histidinol-phosphate transaminase [Clostridium ganghwense]